MMDCIETMLEKDREIKREREIATTEIERGKEQQLK